MLDASGAEVAADGSAAPGDGTTPIASTTVLRGDSGWAASQSLILLVGLLTLALVVAPPLIWQRVTARSPVNRAPRSSGDRP